MFSEVPEYEGLYSISRNGELYSHFSNRVMKPWVSNRGYHYVHLLNRGHKKHLQIHQIVALTFLGPPPIGMEVNHKDGNPGNNRLENLEYVSHRSNLVRAKDVLGKKHWCKDHLLAMSLLAKKAHLIRKLARSAM